MPFTGTITATQLHTELDAQTATLTTQATAGRKDQTIFLRLASLADTTNVRDRSVSWVAPDNMQVRIAFVSVTDTVAGRIVTGTLTVSGGDTNFLTDNTVSIEVETVNGLVDSRSGTPSLIDYRSGTPWLNVFKGVRYTLALLNSSAATTIGGPVQLAVQLRTRRRTA